VSSDTAARAVCQMFSL